MLSRDKQPMRDEVKKALLGSSLLDDYLKRPEYQQNDYLAWINRAKQETTRQKRIDQMLDELNKGGVYMKMDHPASSKGK